MLCLRVRVYGADRVSCGFGQYGNDYEIGIGDASWSTLQTAAKAAYSTNAAFDFSAYLL